ncbi:glycosyltransferase [Microvirga terrae]|uniref:Glycosyltransferase n=1 Tax=Microvirga terrae TaxID=2740529 RepID=A0ABY5RMH1_9HYPH|nr:glycosyltransferase [Microvirga terrae]UVF18416.1 glycosyltransferase [Microvirga terrae]
MNAGHNNMPGDNVILLFYKEFEADKFIKYDRYLKRILKPIYHKFHTRQKKTGFAVSFSLLHRALVQAGYDVRINDFTFARQHLEHPVGLVGFPTILEGWDLPNPALLGPSLYDHPGLAPNLMQDERFQGYLVLADWMRDMFKPVYGDRCTSWFAGIDTEEWPDTRSAAKDIDILIYDKIRWDRYVFEPHLLAPIRSKLAQRGLQVAELRYKFHDHRTYQDMLRRSKAMLFLCEHETQGIAYQEALACNVPVLAWDFGMWADPLWKIFSQTPIPASSVPFFSDRCGRRFRVLAEFDNCLQDFLDNMDSYEPRQFVSENLSLSQSAHLYASQYFSLLKRHTARSPDRVS